MFCISPLPVIPLLLLLLPQFKVAVLQDTPMLQPFWAAGMSFSRGHFITRVPYDCCLPMLFQVLIITTHIDPLKGTESDPYIPPSH
jgi:hypothetical protein